MIAFALSQGVIQDTREPPEIGRHPETVLVNSTETPALFKVPYGFLPDLLPFRPFRQLSRTLVLMWLLLIILDKGQLALTGTMCGSSSTHFKASQKPSELLFLLLAAA